MLSWFPSDPNLATYSSFPAPIPLAENVKSKVSAARRMIFFIAFAFPVHDRRPGRSQFTPGRRTHRSGKIPKCPPCNPARVPQESAGCGSGPVAARRGDNRSDVAIVWRFRLSAVPSRLLPLRLRQLQRPRQLYLLRRRVAGGRLAWSVPLREFRLSARESLFRRW